MTRGLASSNDRRPDRPDVVTGSCPSSMPGRGCIEKVPRQIDTRPTKFAAT